MILRALAADWIKLRRTWVIWLTLLGPIGNLFAQWVNYLFRKDFLLPYGWMGKHGFFTMTAGLVPFSIIIGMALIASISSGHEHDAKSFKTLFALLVTKPPVFISKWIWMVLLLSIAAGLTVLGLGWLGAGLGLPKPIPWAELTKLIVYPYCAAFPFLTFQLWLSLVCKGQAWPIAIGITGGVMGPFLAESDTLFRYWFWSYPYRAVEIAAPDVEQWVIGGFVVSLVIGMMGMIHFTKREVDEGKVVVWRCLCERFRPNG